MGTTHVACGYPTFLPWAGFWHRLLPVDVAIWETGVDVSYAKEDQYHNRVKIGSAWMTLPLLHSHRKGPYNKILVDTSRLDKLVKTLSMTFGKRYKYSGRLDPVKQILGSYQCVDNVRLQDINQELLDAMGGALGVQRSTIELPEPPESGGTKTSRLIDRIRSVVPTGVIRYYTGRSGLDYLDLEVMSKDRIQVLVQTLSQPFVDTSAVQLIAQEENPIDAVQAFGGWEAVT